MSLLFIIEVIFIRPLDVPRTPSLKWYYGFDKKSWKICHEDGSLPQNWNLKTRSVLKDSEANSFDHAEVWKAQSRARTKIRRARFTRCVSADGSVYCTAWKTRLQISGKPRAGKISRNIRDSDLRAKIACKILTLVFAPRCFQTKFYGAISTTITHSLRRLEYNRGLEKQDRQDLGCQSDGEVPIREIAVRDWLGGWILNGREREKRKRGGENVRVSRKRGWG